MEMIMMRYHYQNKKTFFGDHISSYRHNLRALNILAELPTQTSAQSGSTRTGSFHGLGQRLVHEEGPPHYGAKAEIERTSLPQTV